ncbi:Eph receptor B1 [Pelomyxa schiedti]|nr:Eph receptor B1 [Pelomyxa schiedti]
MDPPPSPSTTSTPTSTCSTATTAPTATPTTPTTVAEWLSSLHPDLAPYAAEFARQAVTLALLPTLSDDDLVALGVDKIGHRRRVGREAARLPRPGSGCPCFCSASRHFAACGCATFGACPRCADVATWLRGVGLPEHAGAFEREAVLPDLLAELSDGDLKKLGVEKLGHRRLIMMEANLPRKSAVASASASSSSSGTATAISAAITANSNINTNANASASVNVSAGVSGVSCSKNMNVVNCGNNNNSNATVVCSGSLSECGWNFGKNSSSSSTSSAEGCLDQGLVIGSPGQLHGHSLTPPGALLSPTLQGLMHSPSPPPTIVITGTGSTSLSPNGTQNGGLSVSAPVPTGPTACTSTSVSVPSGPNRITGDSPLKKVLLRNVELQEVVGIGGFGEVWKGLWEGTAVAIKRPKEKGSSLHEESLIHEAEVWMKMRHPHIVSFYGLFYKDGVPHIITEFMPEGSLDKFLHNNKDLPMLQLLGFAKDTVLGMVYLESNKIVHRDLAARNLLLKPNLQVCVSDFGLSRSLIDSDTVNPQSDLIPLRWAAPEYIQYHVFSSKSDVWSFGVVLWEILTSGSLPYEGIPSSKILSHIQAGNRLPPPPNCPNSIYEIMSNCWNPNADKRPTFKELSYHLKTHPHDALLNLYMFYCEECWSGGGMSCSNHKAVPRFEHGCTISSLPRPTPDLTRPILRTSAGTIASPDSTNHPQLVLPSYTQSTSSNSQNSSSSSSSNSCSSPTAIHRVPAPSYLLQTADLSSTPIDIFCQCAIFCQSTESLASVDLTCIQFSEHGGNYTLEFDATDRFFYASYPCQQQDDALLYSVALNLPGSIVMPLSVELLINLKGNLSPIYLNGASCDLCEAYTPCFWYHCTDPACSNYDLCSWCYNAQNKPESVKVDFGAHNSTHKMVRSYRNQEISIITALTDPEKWIAGNTMHSLSIPHVGQTCMAVIDGDPRIVLHSQITSIPVQQGWSAKPSYGTYNRNAYGANCSSANNTGSNIPTSSTNSAPTCQSQSHGVTSTSSTDDSARCKVPTTDCLALQLKRVHITATKDTFNFKLRNAFKQFCQQNNK